MERPDDSLIEQCDSAIIRYISELEQLVDNKNSKTQLKQIIFKLESELEDIEVEKAEQQITGYVHAKRGYSLESLADSMGLTESEWENIKFNSQILGMNADEVEELDEWVSNQKKLNEG